MFLPRILLVALAVFALLFGRSTGQAAEVQFWHAMTGALNDHVNTMVKTYNESQKEHTVVATFKGTYPETINQTIAAFRAKKQPHLVQVFEVGTLTMMLSGAVYPVHQLMKEQGYNIDWSKFIQPVLGYYMTPEGNLMSMPFNSSTPIFYFNLEHFKKAGIHAPPQTWDEMEAAVKALRASGQECAYTTSWQSWVHLENYSALHNIPFASKANGFKGLDTVLEFNNPQVVKHIARLAKWTQEGSMSYEGRTNQGTQAFQNGKCSMLTESSAGYANITRNAKFEWSAAPLPVEKGTKPLNSIIGGATLWVLQGHSKEDYAGVASFLNYVASVDNQVWWHETTGYLPITQAAYAKAKADGYYKQVPVQETGLKQMMRATPTEISRGLRLGNFVQIRTVIDEELEGVWAGKKSPKEGLDEAVRRGNELLRQFEQLNKQ